MDTILYGDTGLEFLTHTELERLIYIEPENQKARDEKARRDAGGVLHGWHNADEEKYA